MIFELLYQKITARRKAQKECEHDWRKTGYSYYVLREMFTAHGYRDLYTCDKCDKKEKRLPKESHTYIRW